MFWNRPARKLFQRFITNSCNSEMIFNKLAFNRVKMDLSSPEQCFGSSTIHEMPLFERNQRTTFMLSLNQPISLAQIVMAQKDEPNQRNCVFKLKAASRSEKYFQIRVKSINFFQKDATAVYMYDITDQVKALELGSQLYN